MSYPLNNVSTANAYSPANTVDNIPVCARVNFDVVNAAIFYQLRAPTAGQNRLKPETWDWQPEVRLNPSFRSFERVLVGYRIRSAVPGSPAIVTVDAITKAEIG